MKHLILTIWLPIILVSFLHAERVQVNPERDNQIEFSAPTTISKVVGTTDAVEGYVQWQENDWTTQSEFSFQVDLAAIDTGIGLRNKHMRNKYLETDTYPYATYNGSITQVDATSDTTWNIQTAGTMTIHGVEQQVEVSGTVTETADGYAVDSEFELNISDYDIKQPQFLLVKMNKVVSLSIRFYTTGVAE